MGKQGKILPAKYKQIAEDNNIPLQTVYRRLKNNWLLEKAVSTPSSTKYSGNRKRAKTGELLPNDRPKSKKIFGVTVYQDQLEDIEKEIEKSNKSTSTFFADILDDWIKNKDKNKSVLTYPKKRKIDNKN